VADQNAKCFALFARFAQLKRLFGVDSLLEQAPPIRATKGFVLFAQFAQCPGVERAAKSANLVVQFALFADCGVEAEGLGFGE
jgi:hypothetical protein